MAVDIPEPGVSRSMRRQRRPYRTPLGMPGGAGNWRLGAAVSMALHALLVALIIYPFARAGILAPIEQGAGGPGPAGGGGGGNRGTGGIRQEALRFVTVAPPPLAMIVARPVVPPPPPRIEFPQPELPRLAAPRVSGLTPIGGSGGGTGADGTAGSGPGTGGGVGSGVGTGRGAGVGPGTGGGAQENFPPSAIEMFIPPMPVPQAARGHRIIVQFDVDERGRVRGIEFTQTPDRGYNRRLREVFENFRFRPGTRPDGAPIRMKWQLEVDLP